MATSYSHSLDRVVNEPLSHLSEAVRSMRVSLELSSASSKVILITSALPGEGKSTAAMLLAASSASSGKKTILLDCDLRLRSTSEALRAEAPTRLVRVPLRYSQTHGYNHPRPGNEDQLDTRRIHEAKRGRLADVSGDVGSSSPCCEAVSTISLWIVRLCCRSWMRSPSQPAQTRFW